MQKPDITFEDLAKLAQDRPRTPCGKQAFSKSGARNAARERNKFTEGKTYYPTVCFEGCGKEVFHVTTEPQRGRMKAMFEEKTGKTTAEKARKKRGERSRRRRMELRPQICTWENEGGSYGD